MSSTAGVVAKVVIFTLLVPGSITVAIPFSFLTPGAALHIGGYRLSGILPIVIGASFYFRCAWDFALFGRGTPAPIDPPRKLVSRGLYRLIRNPMYAGVLLVLLGEAILFGSVTILRYALLVGAFFHLFVIYYEEPTLKKKFGAAYGEYCRAVPRWIPGLQFFSSH